MQIYSINPISNNYHTIKQNIQNNQLKANTSNPYATSIQINKIYNNVKINFNGKKVGLNNFNKWIKQNNICERTMQSYERLLISQKNKVRLMKRLDGLNPEISSTNHIINYRCTDVNGNPLEYVIQSISLLKDNKPKGHYDVQYDKNGVIIDNYLVFE